MREITAAFLPFAPLSSRPALFTLSSLLSLMRDKISPQGWTLYQGRVSRTGSSQDVKTCEFWESSEPQCPALTCLLPLWLSPALLTFSFSYTSDFESPGVRDGRLLWQAVSQGRRGLPISIPWDLNVSSLQLQEWFDLTDDWFFFAVLRIKSGTAYRKGKLSVTELCSQRNILSLMVAVGGWGLESSV